MNRREFVETSSKVLLAAAIGGIPVILGGCGTADTTSPSTPTQVAADSANVATLTFADHPELQTAGGSFLASATLSNGKAVQFFVTRVDTTTVKAVSAVCTHDGCMLNNYNPSNQDYVCGCHNSIFGVGGNVIQGPARAPLTTYASALSDTGIKVTLA